MQATQDTYNGSWVLFWNYGELSNNWPQHSNRSVVIPKPKGLEAQDPPTQRIPLAFP